MHMKIILKEDVKNLGKKNNVYEVSAGYARNFLFPKKLAVLATPYALKTLAEQEKAKLAKQKEKIKEAKTLAEKLKKLTIILPCKATDEGKLFGSVNREDIALAIKEKIKIELDKKMIEDVKSIKKVGEYKIKISLYKDINPIITLKITKA